MLKTTSRAARDNIKTYIMENSDFSNYERETPATFAELAPALLEIFRDEFYNYSKNYYKFNEYLAFSEWCAGLPSVLDTCYYYNRSAVDDVAAILEETPEEAAKYSEADAEKLLTHLIYRELTAQGEEGESIWFIMSDYIRPARIEAETAADALSKYAEKLEAEYYITISKTAIKNKSDMFIDSADGDPVKSGYVITAATDFQADNGDMKKQYIDLLFCSE